MILASPKRESAGIHILSRMAAQISDRDLSCISKTMEPHGRGMGHWAPNTQLHLLAADLAIDQAAQVLAIGVLILGGLKGACQRHRDPSILLSGAGGPLAMVTDELRILGLEVNIILTDLFPNPGRNRLDGGRSIRFRDWPEPVDARQPASLKGIYTMFGSFHHFRPDDAYSILRNAFDRRLPICVFEATSQMAAPSAILIPILVLVLTPRIRPFSWLQIPADTHFLGRPGFTLADVLRG